MTLAFCSNFFVLCFHNFNIFLLYKDFASVVTEQVSSRNTCISYTTPETTCISYKTDNISGKGN